MGDIWRFSCLFLFEHQADEEVTWSQFDLVFFFFSLAEQPDFRTLTNVDDIPKNVCIFLPPPSSFYIFMQTEPLYIYFFHTFLSSSFLLRLAFIQVAFSMMLFISISISIYL